MQGSTEVRSPPGIWAGRDAPRRPSSLQSEASGRWDLRAGRCFLPALGKRRSGRGTSAGGSGARSQVRARRSRPRGLYLRAVLLSPGTGKFMLLASTFRA